MDTCKKIIGIMTGNSMDACDVVLTAFEGDKITDLCGHSQICSPQLREQLQGLRKVINEDCISMGELQNLQTFHKAHDQYIQWVADTVNQLIMLNNIQKSDITAIGFHGQTLDHCPPSVAAKKNIFTYTLQIGSGQMLADLTDIPVIYDFRSDDLMAGGEAAPLVPHHNGHLAKNWGLDDAIFYNAGNTSNLAVISNGKTVQGFDAGPFNEFTDKLVRQHTPDSCDWNGKYGRLGKLQTDLLQILFKQAAVTANGDNFLELAPPRSSDPKWYHYLEITELQTPKNLNDAIHTSEYFSAYVAAYALKFVKPEITMPSNFVLFGGGWHNPVAIETFNALLNGEAYVLPQHKDIFTQIIARFQGRKPVSRISDLGKFMEARLFADLARCHLENTPWSTPELTGCSKPVILGVMRKPHQAPINDKINRAAKGWQNK